MIEPLAVLNAPPVTTGDVSTSAQDAGLVPAGGVGSSAANACEEALAVLPKPPVTLATKPLAVFSSPLMTLAPR